MRIDQPYYLALLVLIPVAVLIFIRFIRWRRIAFSKWASQQLIDKIFPGISGLRTRYKFIALVIALLCIVLALANFQLPSSASNVKRNGVDVAILLDVSNSMLSQDVSPNRLSQAKEIASEILDQSPQNRISLVTFAGTAITMVPMTPDHSSVEMILNSINANTIPDQGSDIGNGIREAIRSLPENQNHYRAIILISDGEDLEHKINEALDLAAKSSTVIFSVGVGTSRGGDIPVPEGNYATSIKKDEKGQTVITKLHPEILMDISKKTAGNYFQFDGGNRSVASSILKQTSSIGSDEYNQKILSGYNSQFQYFLFPALLLLIIELFIRNRKAR